MGMYYYYYNGESCYEDIVPAGAPHRYISYGWGATLVLVGDPGRQADIIAANMRMLQ